MKHSMLVTLSICDRLFDFVVLVASIWAVGKGCSMVADWLPYVVCGGIGILFVVGVKLRTSRGTKGRSAK